MLTMRAACFGMPGGDPEQDTWVLCSGSSAECGAGRQTWHPSGLQGALEGLA